MEVFMQEQNTREHNTPKKRRFLFFITSKFLGLKIRAISAAGYCYMMKSYLQLRIITSNKTQ
jgi:hypothetical protein